MMLAARRPELHWVNEGIAAALDPHNTTDDRDRVRLGVAFVAVELWAEPED